ncbi:hypothetical protein LEP1GSC096_3647 [Leptospira interrogans serovar Hebdomadis str. R499]|nr:hypothetical protein LEP1GSC045_3378 [Leptospira interrogans serovar Pomona str. Kennewicki LC82-25]EKN98186.1 hypothetical protein LEP1GSC014_0966 [Leptospira interrogans serovar Pomona str. Pomona]EKO71363.1 hypothetical protein LEP1GSC069_3673 [Leptospira interrogans serovar Canicola str. Fiocruz LV133]EKR35060.1 hypothetical protein LEP1GSC096_3647 [Leptospira interrogans serovar Hebdomadis str. R499]EKR81983.1 hypothetical protein LEP1GSC099_1560 [Leptospira interrogans str. UI 08452]E
MVSRGSSKTGMVSCSLIFLTKSLFQNLKKNILSEKIIH